MSSAERSHAAWRGPSDPPQSMQPREFYIPTTWRIKGRVEQVYDVLSRPREFPRWWPEVYLAVEKNRWAMQRGFEGLTRELERGGTT